MLKLGNAFKSLRARSSASLNIDEKAIDEFLTRGVEEVIVLEHLRKSLASGRSLRVKFGIDPTSPNIHLGHTVPLRKLRQFQDMGHQAILLIGDETAMIGDPTGRRERRKRLTREEVDQNMKNYLDQAAKILNMNTIEVRYNHEWFRGMSTMKFLELSSLVSVNQLLQRKDFRQRIENEEDPLTALEACYPMMQGYDSVELKADVELGGVDQKLNLLMGRQMQRKFDQSEQDVMMVPLLVGTDGTRKMSKSFENDIALRDEPDLMFGKLMSVPDDLIVTYFLLLTMVDQVVISKYEAALASGKNPRDVKLDLASEIVRMYHGDKLAKEAREGFISMFSKGEVPEDMPEFKLADGMMIVDVLVASGLCSSKGAARRDMDGGGVRLDGETVSDYETRPSSGSILQKGKRHFLRMK